MKKVAILLFFFGMITACEDVIDVPLNVSEPKLVIEASFLHNEEANISPFVKLTTSIPFYDTELVFVNDAEVTAIDENSVIYTFSNTNEGMYFGNFAVDPDLEYTLQIIYNNETYTATEQMNFVAPLEFVEQNDTGGFSGDEIELKAFFTDPSGEENYYFFEGFSEKGRVIDTFFDEFFDGNTIFAYYFVDDLQTGDEVIFRLFGSDEQFYNYIFTLQQQSTDQSDGPFQTQPATVRGNIVNETNPENFPLGYFRIAEVSVLTYTVQ